MLFRSTKGDDMGLLIRGWVNVGDPPVPDSVGIEVHPVLLEVHPVPEDVGIKVGDCTDVGHNPQVRGHTSLICCCPSSGKIRLHLILGLMATQLQSRNNFPGTDP